MPERMGSPSSRKSFWSSPEKECRRRGGLGKKRQGSGTGLERKTKGEIKMRKQREGEREKEEKRWEGRKEGGTDGEQDTEPSNICKEAAVLSDRGQQVWR